MTLGVSLAALTLCTLVLFFPLIRVVVIKLATTHGATLFPTLKDTCRFAGQLRTATNATCHWIYSTKKWGVEGKRGTIYRYPVIMAKQGGDQRP